MRHDHEVYCIYNNTYHNREMGQDINVWGRGGGGKYDNLTLTLVSVDECGLNPNGEGHMPTL